MTPAGASGENDEENGQADDEDVEDEGWKTRAPGLRRGMKLDGGERLCQSEDDIADILAN